MISETLSAYEALTVMISGISALLTVAGVAAIFVQVRQAARGQAEDHLRQCRQATVDFWTETMAHRIAFQDTLPNERDKDAVAAFLPDPTDWEHERNKMISGYLHYLELLATGVNLGIYDLDTIDYIAGPRLIESFESYQPWIEGRRILFNSRTMYCEWEILAQTLRIRRNSAPVRS